MRRFNPSYAAKAFACQVMLGLGLPKFLQKISKSTGSNGAVHLFKFMRETIPNMAELDPPDYELRWMKTLCYTARMIGQPLSHESKLDGRNMSR